MIKNETELQAALDRIDTLHKQVRRLRKTEPNPNNYHASASGFLAEIDRMQLEIREYLKLHPAEMETVV